MISLCILLLTQDRHLEYLEAERAARRAIELLGVSTKNVAVRYEDFPPDSRAWNTHPLWRAVRGLRISESRLRSLYDRWVPAGSVGQQSGNLIRINTRQYPENLETLFHEFWHYYQQERVGGYARFTRAYGAYEYRDNPFEREADWIGRRLYGAYEFHRRTIWGRFHTYDEAVLDVVRRDLPRLQKMWGGARPDHHRFLGERLPPLPKPTPLASFLGGYLFKEALVAIEKRDAKELGAAFKDLGFWISLGGFTAAARFVEHRLPGWTPRWMRVAVPLTAGMAAVELLSGHASVSSVAIGVVAYSLPGVAIGFLPKGPAGWLAGGAYTVAKLGTALYLGEKLERFLRSQVEGITSRLHSLFGEAIQ